METSQSKPNSPWVSFAILFGLLIGCSFGTQLVVLISYAIGSGNLQSLLELGDLQNSSAAFKYSLLGASSIGTFVLPPLLLQYVEKNQVQYFPTEKFGQWTFLLLAFLFLIAFNPVMSIISEWNMNMKLPNSLSEMETWMMDKELEMAKLTESIVMTTSLPHLFINIIVIAVLPAIGEELFFRGAIQGIFARIIKNQHIVIWLTAIIFSAIHIQFYGFLPRLLLGAFFGYMFIWSKNIWIPIFAHFLNNASVTVIAFIFAKQGKTYEELMNSEFYHIGFYIVGLVVSFVIAWYFYSLSLKGKSLYGTGLG